MDAEEERYLRAVAKASDDVKFNHQHLQKMVQRGTRSQVMAAGEKVIKSTETLLGLIDQGGRWPESY